MRTTPLLLASTALLATGCGPDNGLRALPNSAPVAVAAVYEEDGLEETSAQFLGYTLVEESATLDASLSRDSDGSIEGYTWTFEAVPEGSLLTSEDLVPGEDDPETEVNEGALLTFSPDTLGTYRLGLVVTDDDGADSDLAYVFIQAVPPSGLRIQLGWDQPATDLDLHLTEPGGVYFDYEGGSDCFSWSPNPDWGDANLALDNPLLEGDEDGVGAAPYRESIFLDTPTDTTDADYLIRVHYYSDHSALSGGSQTPANPTVTVRVLDNVIATVTPGEPMLKGDVWVVGTLSWPDRVFSQIGTMTTHETLGGPAYQETSD
jgi:hypothetical protein